MPTRASTAMTPASRYFCPHAQPLRSGVFESNHAIGTTPADAASGPRRHTGLLSKKKSVSGFMPAATARDVSTCARTTEPGA